MRILFLSPRQCSPPQSGAKLREYYLLRALCRDAVVTHVSFAEGGGARADLPFCERVISVPRPRGFTPAKILKGLLGRWPVSVVNYLSPAMMSSIAGLAGQPFDLIHLDSMHMAGYVPLLRRVSAAPMVYDWHNIESEIMRRYSLHVASLLRSRYAAITARRLRALEDAALRDTFGHLVCSARESAELSRRFPAARIAVIENGVDCEYFAEPAGPPGTLRRLVFVGAMGYHANADAAVYFAREIWPAIWREAPALSFTIVGANPAPEVLALAGSQNIEVTGSVPDVRPYYRDALAAVVPLRVGGGTRLKILEAMAAGVPVISTRLGAEGLDLSPGRDILMAESTDDWTAHLRALSNHNFRNALAAAARDTACARYDWEAIGDKLRQTCRDWLR